MKKFTLMLILINLFSFAFTQDEMIVGWTFPGNELLADTGLSLNLTQELVSFGGTSAIELKNGYTTKAAQASSWENGMDTKGWMINCNTTGFANITISSRQQSGGNDPGPKDFKLQFSTDEGTSWTDVENGGITVENDWETSFVDNLVLPNNCDDQANLSIRWLMTSNEASGTGGPVVESGKSKIDEIYVRGTKISAISNLKELKIKMGPNPTNRFLYIDSETEINQVQVVDLAGKVWIRKSIPNRKCCLDLHNIPLGVYLVRIVNDQNIAIKSHKILRIH
ncbi:MAG: T9SS type A sorting domain-containing protein [Bacteroidetes bacterium]|nr:T9SS type A sorting domain-containing protein [Bacteroidota bacterium]